MDVNRISKFQLCALSPALSMECRSNGILFSVIPPY